MNFFEQQADARKSTTRLVVLFALAILCIIAALYFVFAFVAMRYTEEDGPFTLWHPTVFIWTSLGTLGVIAVASLSKTVSLSEGGSVVAEWMGGRLVDSGTQEMKERRLVNVVEEMAIASGVAVPSIYVIDSAGINAFAAGYSPDDAAVAVTTGCLEELTRDELQGVIAHEFSHVLNGDMKLNIRLIGVLAGILFIGMTGGWILRSMMYSRRRSSSKKDGGGGIIAILLLGFSLLVIGYVGVFFGKLIKAGVSRQREFLADASAVQFTRNPHGIGGALQKIRDFDHGSKVTHKRTEELSHMFFASGFSGRFFSSMFATHPALETRIERIIGPGAVLPKSVDVPSAPAAKPQAPSTPIDETPGGIVAALAAADAAAVAMEPTDVLNHIGAPTKQHLALGGQLIANIPDALREAATSTLGAVAAVYGVLLDEEDAVRQIQLEQVASNADHRVGQELQRLLPHLTGLDPRIRLVLVELAMPALRQLVPAQYQEMRTNVQALVQADEKVTLFEFCLEKMVQVSLEANFEKTKRKGPAYGRMKAVAADVSIILSTLAYAGQDSVEAASNAFQVGLERLPQKSRGAVVFQPAETGFRALDSALDRVARTTPNIKEQVLDASVHVALADGTVTVEEGEMVRAVAHAMGCPVPPLLAKG